MKLAYSRRISSRVFRQAQRQHLVLRSFGSARPLPDERHDYVNNTGNVQEETFNSSSNNRHPKKLSLQPNKPKTTITSVVSNDDNNQELITTEHDSPSDIHYTGSATMPLTTVLHIVKPHEDVPRGIWPVFRLMDENGTFRDPSFDAARQKLKASPFTTATVPPTKTAITKTTHHPHDLKELRQQLQEQYPFHSQEFENCGLLQESKHPHPDTNSKNTLLRAHRQIVRLREMDTILQNAQRQGRISFYMTCRGEEAIHFGSASALDSEDTVFAQYREAGLLMWRGFTLEQFANQCFANDADLGKGRQMPVHYGSRALHYQTISSPLGTQIPQAVGAAYHKKLQGKKNVTVCFFGDGAASTTDFHSGLNFAATLQAPVLFFCRNNGFAISTPVQDQYAGDGIISRAPGYGMAAIRVDGNDIFAVHAAVREARAYALEHSAPVLIEAMTYRLGHHSTSDDSFRYRDKDEVEAFEDRADPLNRLETFLKAQEWITDSGASDARAEEKQAIVQAMMDAEKRSPPSLDELFTDVYYEMTPRLKEQQAKLHEHLERHKDKY